LPHLRPSLIAADPPMLDECVRYVEAGSPGPSPVWAGSDS